VAFFRDIFDYRLCIGTVHNTIHAAVEKVRAIHAHEDLSPIRVGLHDEIFQGDPVLVGVDAFSTYGYLLAQEPHRDAITWGVHLLERQQRGLRPDYTVADGGNGLRAAQAEAWPGISGRGDVFHATCELTQVSGFLDRRALSALSAREKLEQQMGRARRHRRGQALSSKLAHARHEAQIAVQLADDVRLLAQWLHDDVLALIGADHATRSALFDFIVAELQAREALAPHRLRPLRLSLQRQKEELLAFVATLDQHLLALALQYHVAPQDVRALCDLDALSPLDPPYWQQEAALWHRLGSRYRALRHDVQEVLAHTVRASSLVENLNSRLRCYFFLRRHLGPEYLELLRFFLNHRRFPRSRKEERSGKSPAEILAGKTLPHWLEQLGFTLFRRAA
jgi:hypothetical protein